MSGVVLYFDDNADIIKNFKTAFELTGTNLEFMGFSDPALFFKTLKDASIMQRVRILIFDLAKNKDEEVTHSFEIKTNIIDNFNNYRIPIFVHTGFPTYFTELDGKGTVFKIEKSGTSIETICKKIKLMWETGFLEIFCPEGILETGYMKELHRAFTEQFRNNEIEEIIKSIKESVTGDCKKRIEEVFTRIAIRSLVHNITSAVDDGQEIREVGLNAVEHYYRRMSAYPVWTGDIFKKKTGNEHLLVMTPRCDIRKANCDQILVCKILPIDVNLSKKDNFERAINDNVNLTLGKFRILTRTPLFSGGQVDYPSHFTISKELLLADYERVVTLSDELANDIVRKFCAYLLRSGVSDTEIEESKKYTKIISEGTEEDVGGG